jgi:hypothetical protein
VADLLDNNGSTTEARLLCVMSDQLNALCFVLDDIGRYRGMMGDLLDKQISPTPPIYIGPLAIKESETYR